MRLKKPIVYISIAFLLCLILTYMKNRQNIAGTTKKDTFQVNATDS